MKNEVAEIVKKALLNLGYRAETSFAIEYPREKKFGDYSVTVALNLAKVANRPPIEVAEELVEEIKKMKSANDFEKIEVVKPGFINFYLSKTVILQNIKKILKEKNKYGSGTNKNEKILIEYFQPNIAKPLHLGHLRTAIIGDALYKILKFAGYEVDSESHMGDWGTQFGLLLYAYKQWGDDKIIAKDPVNELNKLYIEVNEKMKKETGLKEKGKAEFAKLERGDKENKQLWKKFVTWSKGEYDKVYDIIKFRKADHNWPESFYEDKMPAVVKKLTDKKLLIESQGAKIVDLQNMNLGIAVILKSDGATTYVLRDLATFIHRKKQGYQKQLYVVDSRQSHTLKQTFEILELMGKIKEPNEAIHVSYGILSLPGGTMSSRKGTAIRPRELIGKATELATIVIQDKNPKLKNKEEIAKQVALGAIKYFDLSHNRRSDIVFDWDKVLSFEGNTGPYLQYTHARIKSILRKAKATPNFHALLKKESLLPETDVLLRDLIKFSEVVSEVAESYFPNHLCDYLYKLAGDFNVFYQKVPVFKEEDEQKKKFRLSLISAVAQVIENGLDLLGIEAPEEM